MKKLIFILAIMMGAWSCQNFDTDFDDFDYTTGYFPYQFPVRTLVLGDYIYDNSNDNAHKFLVSVAMGGVYENDKDRVFNIEVDESLCDNILFSDGGDTIKALPASYYTLLSAESKIVIPAGEYNGNIEVQLNDAFFADPDAIKQCYVLPINLVSSTDVDTLLCGDSDDPLADRRIPGEWITAPKNFTMFAVKYINEYHGTYFRYGSNSVTDSTGVKVEDNIYNDETYVESYPTINLITTGRKEVSLTMFLNSTIISDQVTMLLTFNDQGDCTVSAPEGSLYTISGTGSFIPDGGPRWGNKDRNLIEFNYVISDGKNTCTGSESLDARDRAITMELYSPVLGN